MPATSRSRPAGRNGRAMQGILQVMVAAIVWSSVGVATGLVPESQTVPEGTFGVGRMLVGGPALLILALCITPRSLHRIRRMSPRRLVEFAAGSALFQLCMFKSFILLGITPTVFLTVCLPPLIGTLWELLTQPRTQCPGIYAALAIAGTGVLVVAGGNLGEAASVNATGMLIVTIGSAGFVVMTSAARELTQENGALLVTGVGLSLTGLVLIAYEIAAKGQALAALRDMDWHLGGIILYLGLGPTAFAYALYCAGIARCRTANIGLIASMLEPAVAAILARLLLGEVLTTGQTTGCALVMAAMVILWKSEQRRDIAAKGRVTADQASLPSARAVSSAMSQR